MTGATAVLADLLTECDAHGIRLSLADNGGLEIDAPQDALKPELLARLRANKTDLLATLQSAAVRKESLAASIRQFAKGNISTPLFRGAAGNTNTLSNSISAVCRCGSTKWRDVPIHGGQTIRRDCARCGRFIDFPIWHGNHTGQ